LKDKRCSLVRCCPGYCPCNCFQSVIIHRASSIA